jgi:agmatine/peptidylarginine deiminase
MDRSLARALVTGAAGLLAAAAGAAPPDAPTLDLAMRSLRDCALPPSLQAEWDARTIGDEELAQAMLTMRTLDPVTFATTLPPPAGVQPVADFSPMKTLHLVYPSWTELDTSYAVLLREATREGVVRVAALDAEARARLGGTLHRLAIPADRVVITEARPESIWIRDYGPIPVRVDGTTGWIDTRYSADCIDNDAWPTREAPAARVAQVWRPPLYLDGGNLTVDEKGRCYTTNVVMLDNAVEEAVVREQLARWFGCRDVLVLAPLQGATIDHVDMMVAPAPDDTLLVATFDRKEDPANHAVMTHNLATLAAMKDPPKLVKLPSPQPGQETDEGRLVRSWANLLPFNGVVFVPEYIDADPKRRAAARATIAAAFPGRRVVPVPSDELIDDRGAVHCIARATP